MKLTLAMVAAVLVCLCSLVARSHAMQRERAYLDQEKLALAAIDAHLRVRLPRLTNH